ncbi:heavy-metal-associated domain-containing protein [Paenibacillus sp. GCM10012307]|uniref:Heavy-metal-associated domain-containing protein n=1 Tax=Paenibacillus roseus TaxID=2798579 RepID=A0A934JBD5_9BACL|nr:cation transporter [Paenibacillus roseus]MBJ6363937.1 heavy-metal-associated domain-containing protein [Paenibacillus roseus]
MKEATVKVQGMSCRSCVAKIEGAISAIGAEGHVNLEQGTVDVRFDEGKIQINEIEEVIRKKGYNVEA